MEAYVMNKRIIMLALTFCLVLGCSGIAAARNIDFENRTDFHWVGLYINYDGQGAHWGENLLSDQVNRGDSVTIDVHGTNRDLFKVKIVERIHGEYKEVIWHDVNFEDASRVIMHYDRRDGQAYYKIIRG
jgi:hypothetical protein